MPHPILGRERRTGKLSWFAAAACAVLAAAVILAGAVVTALYVLYRPKTPTLRVTSSRLLSLQLDPARASAGVRMVVDVVAENRNPRSHASFDELSLFLRFSKIDIAELRAGKFNVVKNGTYLLHYMVESRSVPFDKVAMVELEDAVRRNKILFNLRGRARTRWRLGMLVPLGFWTHMSCQLLFFPYNGSNIGIDCSPHSQS